MARGSASRFAALLTGLALALSACQPGVTETPPTSGMTSTTTTAATTNTTGPTTPTTSTVAPLPGAEVLVPEGDGPFPTVVLVHGGGWIVGNPSTMAPLADHFTRAGYLTVNTSYQLSLQTPGFPGAIEDVSCAVAFAANHPLSTGEVNLVGHSAGAHIAAIVALDAGTYDDDCDVADAGSPKRFVGLAGPYDIDRVGPVLVPFFGVERGSDPDLWATGNPLTLIGLNPDIEVLLIHGDADQVVPPDFSEEFATELELAGVSVDLEILHGVDHPGARSARNVGDLIVEWMER